MALSNWATTLVRPEIPLIATIVDASGVRRVTAAEVAEQAASGRFFWLDLCGGDTASQAGMLRHLKLDESDMAWALRWGQAGRVTLSQEGTRAVTWLADASGPLTQVNLLGGPKALVTVWSGNHEALNDVRQHYAERAAELEKSHFHATAILLQLLVGTLDQAITALDQHLDALQVQLDQGTLTFDSAVLAKQLQKLHSAWATFDRYRSAVRLAIVGVEALPGMGTRGAIEFNDYADQVEDVEHRLHTRSHWISSLMHDHSTALAERQGEQITRLTLVSVIFLPLTFFTGFFGMNFQWMNDHLGGAEAFWGMGVIAPALSVVLTTIWLRKKGML